jgi:hypothetical protein
MKKITDTIQLLYMETETATVQNLKLRAFSDILKVIHFIKKYRFHGKIHGRP